MTVILSLPKQSDVEWNVDQCKVVIRKIEGHGNKIKPNLTWEKTSGNWTFELPEDISSTDSVTLEFVDTSGIDWTSRPFITNTKEVDIKRDIKRKKIVEK